MVLGAGAPVVQLSAVVAVGEGLSGGDDVCIAKVVRLARAPLLTACLVR